jgi:hypothetical protein
MPTSAAPAPTRVCISSTKRTTLLSSCVSLITPLRRFSNSCEREIYQSISGRRKIIKIKSKFVFTPRCAVPAMSWPMSSERTYEQKLKKMRICKIWGVRVKVG